MKRMLLVVVLLLLAVVAVGFYQGWFLFSQDDTRDETNFTITVDEEQFRADKERLQDLGQDTTSDPATRREDGSGRWPN